MQNNSSTVSTEIMGGLGNQLFQIFNTIAYSLRHKVPFYFPDDPIKHGERKKTYWDASLLETLKPFIKPSTPSLTYNEKQFHYQAIPPPPPPPLKLFGYFQSYKYFQDQQEDIYKFIKLRESQTILREKTQQHYNYTNDDNNTPLIAIHFRVGDYKNLPNHHPLMTLEYYTEALKQLLDYSEATQNSNMHNILYFCEETDQDYVQKQMILPLKANPLFTDKIGSYQCINHKLEDWEQLLVMSLCQKHIIANSTFSWWGAYLSEEKQNKSRTGTSSQVYYPTTWFGPAMGNKNMSDLFPPHWHKINV